jgi:hypothetical protein
MDERAGVTVPEQARRPSMTELENDLAQLLDIQDWLRRIRLRMGRLQSVGLIDADVLLSVAEAEVEREIDRRRNGQGRQNAVDEGD